MNEEGIGLAADGFEIFLVDHAFMLYDLNGYGRAVRYL